LPERTGEKFLQTLREFCESFAEERLRSYTAQVARGEVPRAPKEINDPIWGTIKLQPLEIVLLDSPLLQRLRFIRQLGVVHWVYPGAVHSRLEHTLGVVRQVHELIVAINEATPSPNPAPITQHYAGLLRLCALTHDIGHGVFSHVSEHVLAQRSDIQQAVQEFREDNQLGKAQLSEIAAFFMVGSPSFVDLLRAALGQLESPITLAPGIDQNAARIAELIQKSIVGRKINDSVPLLHELISGPFDADKLDYFIRDARFAGVPTVLDMSRLIQKITVQVVTERGLPQSVAAQVERGLPVYYLFGLKWSGSKVLDELHLARVFLYAKIYRHHKVLALEAMVGAFLQALGDVPGVSSIELIKLCYWFSDDQLLWSDAATILNRLGITADSKSTQAEFANSILSDIRERRAFINALPLQMAYPGDRWANHPDQREGFIQLDEHLGNPQLAEEFKSKLISELKEIARLDDSLAARIVLADLPYTVSIVQKTKMSGGTEIDNAYVFQGGNVVPYEQLSRSNQSAWADAYGFSDASALVFSRRELACSVYIAGEVVLRKEYGIILPSSAMHIGKQSETEIEAQKHRLDAKGYYDGKPFDVRPAPRRLKRADLASFLDEMQAKFSEIAEPLLAETGRRPTALRDRIESWLAQFRTDAAVDASMKLLRSVRILERQDTKDALLKFAEDNPGFRGATIVLLGDLKDSAAVQGYLSRDVLDVFPNVKALNDPSLQKLDAPVVFLDDFVGSGSQLEDIFGQWFGSESLRKEQLKEERELFGEKELGYLREHPVGFVFVSGWNDGRRAAEKVSAELDLNSKIFIHLDEGQIPFAFENVLSPSTNGEDKRFEELCRQIGADLISTTEGDADKIAQRALGYGNRAMLLVTRYNVPTQTLTCLWKGGRVKGADWAPLIARRRKV
jgi:HD superfamily phosphohydrolase